MLGKVVAVLVLVLAVATIAQADSINWAISVFPYVENPSEPTGSMGDVFFGAWTGNTDGTDTDPNLDWGDEAGSGPALPMPGIAAKFTGTGGWFDFKAPFTGTESKVYTLTTFEVGGEITDPVSLYFTTDWPEATEYNPPYSIGGVDYQYTFEGPMVPGVSQTFTSDDPMPATWTWTGSLGDELTITVSPRESYGDQSGGDSPQDSGDGAVDQTDSGGGMATATATVGTIAWAKGFADATTLDSDLAGKVVSRTFPLLDYYYVQEPTGECGIRVSDATNASTVLPGDLITIPSGTAQVTTVDGERVIDSPQTIVGTHDTEPVPRGMINKSLGGGTFGPYTLGPVDGVGLNNVGLLVRGCGKITEIDYGNFYIDDGSKVTDGGTATGIRVVGLGGYQPYTPTVGDYVAVTAISGLATYNPGYGLARTIRVAGSSDLNVVQYAGPPTEVEVQPTGTDINGYGKLTIYWKAVPGAIGYNIYRGTTSSGEDYQNPINGSTPWNTPSYPGSDRLAFTDTGLTFWQEYFYTVKAVRPDGESIASDEDSDMPDDWAIPWDSDDAYAITNAVANLYGYYPDLTCAVGPDGTVYSSWEGVLRPGGSVDLGTLEPGTNTLHYSDGSSINLPDDGGILSGEDEEESGMGLLTAVPTTQQNSSDGPYRRVRSISSCTGSYGVFYPGWRNQINMAKNPSHVPPIDDDYWTYLGSRSKVWNARRQKWEYLEVDAGLQWSEVYFRYNPYLSMKNKRYNGAKARALAPKNCPITFDTSYFGGIEMCYAFQPTGKSSTPMILFYGADQNWEEKTVLLAAANPVKVTSGMMKRAHSIAQGKEHGNRYRLFGSHVYNAAFSNGKLRNASGQWVTWTSDLTQDQGAYPWPSSIVTWTIPSGQEYYTENSISIQL